MSITSSVGHVERKGVGVSILKRHGHATSNGTAVVDEAVVEAEAAEDIGVDEAAELNQPAGTWICGSGRSDVAVAACIGSDVTCMVGFRWEVGGRAW
ncbi:uncharacterized protein A4U43_C02F11670 [Asparagus officinalis]|uniref:Uncharacterized protein n=1 Tax=Asparagus officinalis TaxID=4686 RepID=A0A5P1FMM7_ASPOF|nr:uncharacterized protein A4U43_C02F11670 [Asparagus officinalis]